MSPTATQSSTDSFCSRSSRCWGGRSMPFNRVLIANRGEVAVRVIRALHELDIEAVAVYSTIDEDSLHVRLADRAVCIGPAPAAESYLRIPSIIAAANTTGCQAVHPGWGFLAENPAFAQACAENDLIFIGPSPEVLARMGDKASAREEMRAAGVPLVPGAPPLEGADPVETARAEAEASFGDGRLYLEKAIVPARHVEIQALGDLHGGVLTLGERECSIQRRHQKLIEESPSPALTPALREEMEATVEQAVRSIGYTNAGTFEFILGPDGSFYFIELNARLQVEHPVIELVTGIDLAHEQLRVAAGEPLEQTGRAPRRGHAIEVRVNAEDPSRGFLPTPGKITRFRPPLGPGVRVDTHVVEDAVIPPQYDSLLAKVVAWAPDRDRALARCLRALNEFEVVGIPTTIAAAAQEIRSEGFAG